MVKKRQIPKYIPTLVLAGLMVLTTIMSALADFAPPPSASDTATFGQIVQPIWKVYNLVKFVATGIAALFILLAGVKYIMSGNDAAQRENAKQMIGYVILGLIVIWVTPFIVQLFTVV